MGVALIKKKRYLTGIDWVIGMFDHLLKRRTGAGHASQIIITLDGLLDEARFLADITAFTEAFPVLRGTVRRDITLAPHWKIPRQPPPFCLPFTSETLSSPTDSTVPTALADHVNDPFPDDSVHLAFHVAHDPRGQTWLSMVFDHRLFDARGAEGFLTLFESWRGTRDLTPIINTIALTEPVHLSQWRRKFKAGQTVNRTLLAAAQSSHRLADLSGIRSGRIRFNFFTFTEAETAAIQAKANDEAGFLMLSPFLLAVCLQALHHALARTGRALPAYIIPISMDRRQPGAWRTRLFFNHLSFLFLTAPAQVMHDRSALIASLLHQIYDQTKQRVQDSYTEAAMLMRIVPLPLLGHLARLPFKGEFGSLSFSYLGDTLLSASTFMDQPLSRVCHGPRVPIPPGLGFFFNLSQNKLNLTLAYHPEILDDGDLELIGTTLRAAFGFGQR